MTLLEAISPTARELLNGVGITKGEKRRIHARRPDGQPLCGGGQGGKLVAAWQEDLAGVNCAACATIINRRSKS